MSFIRQFWRLIKYSPSPLRKTHRPIITSAPSIGMVRSSLSKVKLTSAMPRCLRELEPEKMISAAEPARRARVFGSPNAHSRASTRLLLPQPLGPTIAVRDELSSNSVRSAKDLNPKSLTRLRCNVPSLASAMLPKQPLLCQVGGKIEARSKRYGPEFLPFQGGIQGGQRGVGGKAPYVSLRRHTERSRRVFRIASSAPLDFVADVANNFLKKEMNLFSFLCNRRIWGSNVEECLYPKEERKYEVNGR